MKVWLVTLIFILNPFFSITSFLLLMVVSNIIFPLYILKQWKKISGFGIYHNMVAVTTTFILSISQSFSIHIKHHITQ